MKRWHPDRHTQDTESGRQAEEMTKQINQAYQELFTYFEEHGHLPLDGLATTPAPQAQPQQEASSATVHHGVRSSYEPRRPSPPPPSQKRSSRLAAFVVICLLATLFWLSGPFPDGSNNVANVGSESDSNLAANQRSTSAPTALTERTKSNSKNVITVGSTLGEVYSIQGVPTRTDGNVWYYGTALVAFSNGRVTHWQDSDPPVLRTSTSSTPASETETRVISRGSTKEEVRAIQGNPMHESATIWDYGQSQIRFDRNGYVVDWTESPFNPLRVKR